VSVFSLLMMMKSYISALSIHLGRKCALCSTLRNLPHAIFTCLNQMNSILVHKSDAARQSGRCYTRATARSGRRPRRTLKVIVGNMVTVDGPAQGCFALYTLLGLFVGRLVTIGASGTGWRGDRLAGRRRRRRRHCTSEVGTRLHHKRALPPAAASMLYEFLLLFFCYNPRPRIFVSFSEVCICPVGLSQFRFQSDCFLWIRIDYTARYKLKNRPAQPSIRCSSKVTLLWSYYIIDWSFFRRCVSIQCYID